MSFSNDFNNPTTVTTGGGGMIFPKEGWNLLTVKKGVYNKVLAGSRPGGKAGSWPDKDSWELEFTFEEIDKLITLQVMEVRNKITGEEFAMLNTFRFANASIVSIATNPEGKEVIIIDRSETAVKNGCFTGCKMNVFFYKEPSKKDPERDIFKAWRNIAPAEHPGDATHKYYSSDDVEYWKGAAEKKFNESQKYSANQSYAKTASQIPESSPISNGPISDDDIPF